MDRIKSVKDLEFTFRGDVFPSPVDWRDVVVYFLLVDRFDDNADHPPYSPDIVSPEREPGNGTIFQGGNLKGLTRRLDYIKGLGADGIWLSPVFKNRVEKNDSYHGYGIQDFLTIVPRFGTKEDLRELVRQAHLKDLYVIMDIIINHTGDNWAYPGDYPYYFWHEAKQPFEFGYWREQDGAEGFQENDAAWPQELQGEDCYKRQGQIRNWYNQDEAINGDFLSLKELDITRADVLDVLIKVYKYWIGYADIDGFRVDTVKHMEDTATALFCNGIREYARNIGKHNFFIFGEVVGDDAVLERYIGRNSRIPGTSERFPSLDGCLDFPLYFILEEVIKGFSDPNLLRQRYERFKTLYTDHGGAGEHFVTFIDNHDQMSRPYRRFMHNNPHGAQAILAVGYLLTSQGVPCIYYGTEQNFDGGGDSDCYVRECMFGGSWGAFDTTGHHFFLPHHHTYQSIAKIATIRKSEPALRYGRQYFRDISLDGMEFFFPRDGKCILCYSRILDTTEILVALNLDGQPRSEYVTIDASLNPVGSRLTDLLSTKIVEVNDLDGRHVVRVDLEPHGLAILKKNSV